MTLPAGGVVRGRSRLWRILSCPCPDSRPSTTASAVVRDRTRLCTSLRILGTCLFFYWTLAMQFVVLLVFHRLKMHHFFVAQLLIILMGAGVDGVIAGFASAGFNFKFFLAGLLHAHIAALAWQSHRAGERSLTLVFGALVQSAVADGPQAILMAYADLAGDAHILAKDSVYFKAVRVSLVTSVLGAALALTTNEEALHARLHAREGTMGPSRATPYWWALLLFRVAEVMSRVSSLAVFAFVMQPNGLVTVMAIDLLLMALLVMSYDREKRMTKGVSASSRFVVVCMLVMTNPSGFCEFAPRVPHVAYFSIRLVELSVMAAVAARHLSTAEMMHVQHDHRAMLFVALASSAVAVALFPCVLRGARASKAHAYSGISAAAHNMQSTEDAQQPALSSASSSSDEGQEENGGR
jgi:hypothetical protein